MYRLVCIFEDFSANFATSGTRTRNPSQNSVSETWSLTTVLSQLIQTLLLLGLDLLDIKGYLFKMFLTIQIQQKLFSMPNQIP